MADNDLLSKVFQFTPPREGRHEFLANIRQQNIISIHTPAGGATRSPSAGPAPTPNFNSRPCGRGDFRLVAAVCRVEHFNSRPCGRGDCPAIAMAHPAAYFNSRPCGRGDLNDLESLPVVFPFQFTPLREGRRRRRARRGSCLYISIHAPAGGATGAYRVKVGGERDFNSRPCGRGDQAGRRRPHRKSISIHAPAGGATQTSVFDAGRRIFQFTPLREGRRILRAESTKP